VVPWSIYWPPINVKMRENAVPFSDSETETPCRVAPNPSLVAGEDIYPVDEKTDQ